MKNCEGPTLSNCCGAKIIMGDLCNDCKEHCDTQCSDCDESETCDEKELMEDKI